MFEIQQVRNEPELRECFSVMQQLRPALGEDEFVDRALRQFSQGYQLLRVVQSGRVLALAGYRISESLGHGKFLYIDDLVADESHRSAGAGGALFDHIVRLATDERCEEVRLDCGVHRFDAHRFYMNKRMRLAAHHFIKKLPAA